MNRNTDRLRDCFAKGLGMAIDRVTDDLAYRSIPEWDSVGHMAMVAQLESAFDVMLDTDEIIDMSSVAVAKQILAKHGISFE